ncbi:recombinase family protein [Hoyosella altamirensis]|nr:recombinase family protein [Hoyosella altamirensis]
MPHTPISRAILYCRVSSDTTGHGKSVADQEHECRAICARNNWHVAEVLTDNDMGASRHSGRQRPAYERLKETLSPGDVLVTWEASRAQRDLAAYTQLRDLCAAKGVYWSYSGRLYDLTKGDDRFTTGLDALLSEKEVEQLRERVLRGKRSRLNQGKPNGRMPYGYRRIINPGTGRTEGWQPCPVTAPIVREIVARLLAGEPINSISTNLNQRGVTPPSVGGDRAPAPEWIRQRLRTMIVTPTYAGLLTHRGTVVGEGAWEPLITVDEHHRLIAILTDPARATYRGCDVKHLLTGIALCDVCDSPVRYFGPKGLKTPRYQCSKSSCVGRRVDMVDLQVTDTLLTALRRWDIQQLTPEERGEGRQAQDDIRALRQRLDAFTDAAAGGEITPAAFARIEGRLLGEIAQLERRAKHVVLSPLVAQLAGENAFDTWEGLALMQRREVIRATCRVRILRSSQRGPRKYCARDLSVEVAPTGF